MMDDDANEGRPQQNNVDPINVAIRVITISKRGYLPYIDRDRVLWSGSRIKSHFNDDPGEIHVSLGEMVR